MKFLKKILSKLKKLFTIEKRNQAEKSLEEELTTLRVGVSPIVRFYHFHICGIAISYGWDCEEKIVDFLNRTIDDNHIMVSSMHSGGSDYIHWHQVRSLLLAYKQ